MIRWIIIPLIICLQNAARDCPRKVVIEGDSFSVVGLKWPLFIRDSLAFFDTTQINFAVSGNNAYQMRDQYITEAHTVRPVRGGDYWFFCYAGINDLSGGKSADTIFNNLKYLWSNARRDGYKVVAFTVIHSLYLDAGKEAQRLALNSLILESHQFDYVVDVASHFDPRTQPELFADNTHLTTEGFRMFAGVVARTLQPYTISPCRPIYLPSK